MISLAKHIEFVKSQQVLEIIRASGWITGPQKRD